MTKYSIRENRRTDITGNYSRGISRVDRNPAWITAREAASFLHYIEPNLGKTHVVRGRTGLRSYCCPTLRGSLTSPTNSSAPLGTWRMRKRNGRLSSRLLPMPAAIVTSVAAPALVPCSVTSM